jgi:hypothetical protein
VNSQTKPVFHLHAWMGREAIMFIQLTPNQFRDMRNQAGDCHIFEYNGNSAAVVVFTEDMTITREQGLQTATSFVRGWYVSTEVDLDKLETKIERGKPAVNPPY